MAERSKSRADVDLAIIGDGPAGMALAAHCSLLGMKVMLIGPRLRWSATYGVWVDEIEGDPVLGPRRTEIFETESDRIVVWGNFRHELARRYAVLNNSAVGRVLQDAIGAAGGEHLCATVVDVTPRADSVVITTTEGQFSAEQVCDASGMQRWQPGPVAAQRLVTATAWQTAYGVWVDTLPGDAAVETQLPSLMDFRPLDGSLDEELSVPTFCYVIPTAQGWLVEETVLAARSHVNPDRLRSKLIARLGSQGEEIVREAERSGKSERVQIPMGGPIGVPGEIPIPFGAAAGMVHPATGYSVTSSVRAAPRVARALAQGGDPWAAVWPRSARFTRRMHQYGAEVLLSMSQAQIAEFFDTFFELPAAKWQAYLRVDSPPKELLGTMAHMFRGASASTRMSLMKGNPRTLRLR
jgi:lycopene beta-cyclase